MARRTRADVARLERALAATRTVDDEVLEPEDLKAAGELAIARYQHPAQ